MSRSERLPLPSIFTGWLQLLRAPNLLTVPGDPLAGYLLANPLAVDYLRLALSAGACICFYAMGLFLNDLLDVEEDSRERPERPLPSGVVSRPAVVVISIILAALGLGMACLLGGNAIWVSVALAICIVLYNVEMKKRSLLGVLTMGLCRALSLLLGAAAVAPDIPFSEGAFTGAGVMLFYVASISQVARSETRPEKLRLDRWLPAIAILLNTYLISRLADHLELFEWIGAMGSCFLAMMTALLVGSLLSISSGIVSQTTDPKERIIPGLVGLLLSSILFVQAALIIAAGMGRIGSLIGILVLILWPLNRKLSKMFYSS